MQATVGLLFIGYFILNTEILRAQSNLKYSFLNVENGLAQNSVSDIIQDTDGFLWIGTADGLNRWDGTNLKYYHHVESDSNSIDGESYFIFHIDSFNRLWIFHNRGISYYNQQKDNFTNFLNSSNEIIFLGEIHHKIYACDANLTTIIEINTKTLSSSFITLPAPFKTNYLWQVQNTMIDAEIFISTDNQILKFNPISKELRSIFKTSKGQLQSGLQKVNTEKHIFLTEDSIYLLQYRKPNISITSTPKDKRINSSIGKGFIFENQLWMGGSKGFYVLDTVNFTVMNEFSSIAPEFYNSDFVYNFYRDNHENLYISTNTSGLYIISPSKNRFRHLKSNLPNHSMTKSIVKTPDNKIITGNFDGGLTIYKPDESCDNIDFDGKKNRIFGLRNLDRSRIYCVSDFKIFVYNHISGKIETELQYSDIETLAYPNFKSWNGKTYINLNTSSNGGFIASVIPSLTFDTLYHSKNEILTNYEFINSNLLLIGTHNRLFSYASDSKTEVPVLENIWVKSIAKSKFTKNIYVATTGGIYVLNEQLKILVKLGEKNGLPDNFFYAVIEDLEGRIWFSSNKGIGYINPKDYSKKTYNKFDGLQSNEFNTGAYFMDDDGILYFGGINGINIIDPKNLYINKREPKVLIHEIWVDDAKWNSDTNYHYIKTLNLTYTQNTFSVYFSADDFSIPEKNTFAYYLENYDNSWFYAGSQHFLRYANLPPGAYKLYLKAANPDGIWGEAKIIQVVIHPPFWKTNLFYFLIGLLFLSIFVSILYLINRFQKIKIKREMLTQQKLEEERMRISRDLHDNVGVQLSYLITNLEWLSNQSNLNENDYLHRMQKISEAGRNAMLTLRETIWAINKKELTVEEFADRFKKYTLNFIEFNPQIQLDFKENIEDNLNLRPAVALNLFRIAQEAYHNALKHSQSTKIIIEFIAIGRHLQFSITDNGTGFDPNVEKDGHYGMKNLKYRAEEINAELQIHSNENTGTTVIVILNVY